VMDRLSPMRNGSSRLMIPRRAGAANAIWCGWVTSGHLTETCDQDPTCPHVITHVETTPATIQDSEVLAPIQEHLRAKDLAPGEHYVDQGYPSGPQLVRQARLGTHIMGLVGQDTSWQQREQTGYALEAFRLDWPRQVAIC